MRKKVEKDNIKNCKNCRWAGCRSYGYDRPACTKHIKEI